tara:strand:- start:10655 stop:11050 length:396 start_codon:yes stop_codon:yes gene_type:complete
METEKTFLELLTAGHGGNFHIVGIFFAIIAAIVVKRVMYLFHIKECNALGHTHEFDGGKWFTQNWLDFLLAILSSYILVVFADYWIHIKELKDMNVLGFTIPITGDNLAYYPLSAIIIQYIYHKWFKPFRR